MMDKIQGVVVVFSRINFDVRRMIQGGQQHFTVVFCFSAFDVIFPYVFVPVDRYDCIQQLRKQEKWTLKHASRKVIGKFTPVFDQILKRAHVRKRTFHCLRNTALTNWFANGMNEHDVMTLAGHSSFATTHAFYLAVADDLVDRARVAAEQGVGKDLARIWHAPLLSEKKT